MIWKHLRLSGTCPNFYQQSFMMFQKITLNMASISYAKDQIVIKRAMEKPWLCSHMQHLSAVPDFWSSNMVQLLHQVARRCGGTKKPGRFPAKR